MDPNYLNQQEFNPQIQNKAKPSIPGGISKPLNAILAGHRGCKGVQSSISESNVSLPYGAIDKVVSGDRVGIETEVSDAKDVGSPSRRGDGKSRSTLIHKTSEMDDLETARQYFEEGLAQSVATLGEFMSVVRCCSRVGKWEVAMSLLSKISEPSSCILADGAAHNAVLDVLLSCGETERANQLVTEMEGRGMLDTVTFNTLLKGLAVDVQGLNKCEELFDVMRQVGVFADAVSYNSVVNAAVRLEQLHTAWVWVGRMQGAGIEPDKVACATLVKALSPSTPKDILQKTLALLDSLDVCADAVLFSTVVDACARLRDTHRLQAALKRFSESSLQPNAHAYGAIIKALSRCGKGAQSWEVWRDMARRGVPASSFALGCLLDALPPEDLDKGLEEFRKQRNLGVEASIVQYGILIRGCVRAGRMEDALQLYHEMRDAGVQCNVVIYNTLIDGFCSREETAKAVALLENMIADGAAASLKAEQAAQALAEGSRTHAQAQSYAAAASALTPDVITYSSLIKGLCREGDIQGAMVLLQQMQTRGVQPDTVLFNTLLDGMAQQGNIDGAEDLLEQMLQGPEFCRPSAFTLTIMVRILGRANRPDRALQLYRELPSRCNFPLDAFCHTAAMATAFAHGRVHEGIAVLNEMLNQNMRPSSRTFASAITGCIRHGGNSHLADAARIALLSLDTPGGSIDAQHMQRLFLALEGADQSSMARVMEAVTADGFARLQAYHSGDNSVATPMAADQNSNFVSNGQRARFQNGTSNHHHNHGGVKDRFRSNQTRQNQQNQHQGGNNYRNNNNNGGGNFRQQGGNFQNNGEFNTRPQNGNYNRGNNGQGYNNNNNQQFSRNNQWHQGGDFNSSSNYQNNRRNNFQQHNNGGYNQQQGGNHQNKRQFNNGPRQPHGNPPPPPDGGFDRRDQQQGSREGVPMSAPHMPPSMMVTPPEVGYPTMGISSPSSRAPPSQTAPNSASGSKLNQFLNQHPYQSDMGYPMVHQLLSPGMSDRQTPYSPNYYLPNGISANSGAMLTSNGQSMDMSPMQSPYPTSPVVRGGQRDPLSPHYYHSSPYAVPGQHSFGDLSMSSPMSFSPETKLGRPASGSVSVSRDDIHNTHNRLSALPEDGTGEVSAE